jgi:hypothetical protein
MNGDALDGAPPGEPASRTHVVETITALVVAPVLLAAFVILFGFPDRTEQLFAWTIRPEMTPLTMGAGYLGGCWFFVRVLTAHEPHRLVGGFAAATAFTILLGIATILHWDRFNHGHVSFWTWAGLYALAPVLLAWLTIANWRSLRRDPGPSGPVVPSPLRWALALVGAAQLTIAIVFFAAPGLADDALPWTLTPLTARTLSAFVAFTGVLLLWPLVDDRWASIEIGLEAVAVGLTATGIGALRARDDFTGPAVSTAVYAAALLLLVGGIAALLVRYRRGGAAP